MATSETSTPLPDVFSPVEEYPFPDNESPLTDSVASYFPQPNLPPQHDELSGDVAIIGMGCRWPGDAESKKDVDSDKALWEFLISGKDSYGEFPADRINVDSWYHPDSNHPGAFYSRGGCFLKDDPRKFDPTFFGINPQETMSLDPAQRKLLEVVYECFESAGLPLDKLSGSDTGCYVGNFNFDHQLMQFRDLEFPQPYCSTGGGIAILSNRISYVFNLRGPSLTLDTACSSSMYALHLACSAIRAGEIPAAVVAGSNLILSPEAQVFTSALGAVSKSSKCHTFDAAADGYARADGVAALYIKSLRQAMTDKDPIRAIIRSTAINANGRTSGIAHPDPAGQEAVMRTAYTRSGLDPALTAYFECHGTGTPVGDPLEVEAVARVFTEGRSIDNPLLIGSIKSNMGHCEPSSGIAGIMKTVLALEHGIIPPNRRVQSINPNVDLRDGRLKVVQESTVWPYGTIRRASVNSFGYGGANAHTILENPDSLAPGCAGAKAKTTTDKETRYVFRAGEPSSFRRLFLLPFSAHNETTLRRNIDALCRDVTGWDIIDLSYTLGCRRSNFSTRAFVIAEGDKELSSNSIEIHKVYGSKELKLGYVFTGQGAQWPRMGAELMESFPPYLRSIRRMDQVLEQLPDPPTWKLEALLQAPPASSKVYQAELSQPLVTAVQVALVDLLDSWNIKPSAAVGHSSGEIAAAYASGLITAAEAIIIAFSRGQSVSHNSMDGSMLAVGLGASAIQSFLEAFDSIAIACHNSLESVTLSGDISQILALKERFNEEGIFARVVETGGNAYHSFHMKAIGVEYEKDLMRILPTFSTKTRGQDAERQRVDFISSVTGMNHSKAVTARYWRRNLESPVLFEQAVRVLVDTSDIDLLLEIGPHPALQGPVRQISKQSTKAKFPEHVATLLRNRNGAECLLQTAGKLFVRGYNVDMQRVNAIELLESKTNSITCTRIGRTIVDLPKYQWQYGKVLYKENRWNREWRLRSHARHDILGSRTPGTNQNAPVWRNILRHRDLPWLKDHKIGNDTIFPTSAYLSMGLEAAMQMAEIQDVNTTSITSFTFENVQIENALMIPEDDAGIEVLLNFYPVRPISKVENAPTWHFTVTSVESSGDRDVFTDHVHGVIGFSLDPLDPDDIDFRPTNKVLRDISTARWYDAFSQTGLNYGPTFQNLSQIKVYGNTSVVEAAINMSPTSQLSPHESRYVIHPGSLDAALQLIIIASYRARYSECVSGFLPISIRRLQVYGFDKDAKACAAAESTPQGSRGLTSNVVMNTIHGEWILKASEIRLLPSESAIAPLAKSTNPFTKVVWKPDFEYLTETQLQRLYPSKFHEGAGIELPVLDQLALHQAVQFHAEYPEFFAQGSTIPQNQRFLDWMTQKVERCKLGKFPHGSEIAAYSKQRRAEEIERLEKYLLQVEGPETRLMCHMYRSLPDIYRGQMTGIQAAIQDHHLDDLYANMKMYHDGNRALKDLVVLLSHKNPCLKIIEIGGGTGSATRVVLPALGGDTLYRGYDTYTFTDVGPAFLAGAQESFKNYNAIFYRSFNMEINPSKQDLGNDFDLVIASNVLHASSNIQNTLDNCRQLLKPGGKLVLFEYVEPKLSWNMILGTFSDFWLGDNDPHFPRREGPFLARSQWRDALAISGFRGIDIILDHFSTRGEAAVIMATADKTNIPAYAPIDPVKIVYRGEPSKFVHEFCANLKALGTDFDLVPLDASANVFGCRVVCFAEITRPLFSTITTEEWEALKSVIVTSSSILWVTRGGLLRAKSPEYAIFGGMAGVIRSENPSCKLFLFDLDQDGRDPLQDFRNIITLSEKGACSKRSDDWHFLSSSSNIIYVSRLYGNFDSKDHPKTHVQVQTQNETLSTLSPGIRDQLAPATETGPPYMTNFEALKDARTPRSNKAAESEAGVFHTNRSQVQYKTSNDLESSESGSKPEQGSNIVPNPTFEASFDANATYLLVGCLGGLGRSLTMWMVDRGARDITFLSRSCARGIEVEEFLAELQRLGVEFKTIKGDVSCAEDVENTVNGCTKPIKGIIHAALSLRDSFFSEMTFEDFVATSRPRIQGTMNLHNALHSSPLDFFLMLNSWATLLGSASQSNYTASNAFMDAFARYRRALGLPATSLCLGQILDVGIVSYMPAYQDHVLRMGMYGNTEAEFLSYCNTAIIQSSAAPCMLESSNSTYSEGHVLAGFEPAGLLAHSNRYPVSDMSWSCDPRFSRILGAVNHASVFESTSSLNVESVSIVDGDDASVPLIVRVHKHVARFLYVPVDDIDVLRPLNSYGIDSMVAAELRNWLLRTFGAYISLLNLLSSSMTVERLAAEVEVKLETAKQFSSAKETVNN